MPQMQGPLYSGAKANYAVGRTCRHNACVSYDSNTLCIQNFKSMFLKNSTIQYSIKNVLIIEETDYLGQCVIIYK